MTKKESFGGHSVPILNKDKNIKTNISVKCGTYEVPLIQSQTSNNQVEYNGFFVPILEKPKFRVDCIDSTDLTDKNYNSSEKYTGIQLENLVDVVNTYYTVKKCLKQSDDPQIEEALDSKIQERYMTNFL